MLLFKQSYFDIHSVKSLQILQKTMGYCTQYHYCNSSSYRVSLTTTPATYPPPRSAFWKGAKPRDILVSAESWLQPASYLR